MEPVNGPDSTVAELLPAGPWATSTMLGPRWATAEADFHQSLSPAWWLEPVHSMRIDNHKHSVLYIRTKKRSMGTQYALNLLNLFPCNNKFYIWTCELSKRKRNTKPLWLKDRLKITGIVEMEKYHFLCWPKDLCLGKKWFRSEGLSWTATDWGTVWVLMGAGVSSGGRGGPETEGLRQLGVYQGRILDSFL